MRKLNTGTGAQYLRPYLKHDDVQVKPFLLGLYSVMGTLGPWMEVNFKLCQGSKCNQSVDFLKWHQIPEGDRLICTISHWRSKQTLLLHDFSNFNQTRSLISTHQRDQNFYFSEMNRFRQRFRRRGSLYLLNQHLLIRESTAWKDWILKLMFRMDKLSDCRRHNGRGEWVLIINAIYLCPTFDNAFQF